VEINFRKELVAKSEKNPEMKEKSRDHIRDTRRHHFISEVKTEIKKKH